ncbi:hypothetical protein V7266_27510 [Neobacillus drentensis]|uniref:hypothetical protein n=1 Tax=Neobacillus drentensis TaxID=220684 RepID=UPI002FFF6006
MKEYNVHEILAILQKYYITDSPQMVTRWIREGKIQGIRSENRKEGYRVSEEELFDYIEELRPGLPSIMEVYEDYVKKLRNYYSEDIERPKFHDEMPDKIESETNKKQHEKEIKELREQIINLENTLVDLQEENQIIHMNMFEIVEQNNSLQKENLVLKEENGVLTELYGIMDEENKLLKCTSNNMTNSEELKKELRKKIIYPTEEKKFQLGLDDFINLSKEVVTKLSIHMEELAIINHLENIYQQIFENGIIRSNLIMEDGAIKCPFTDKFYKQQKRVINNAIKHYFENLNEEQTNQQQEEKTVAND